MGVDYHNDYLDSFHILYHFDLKSYFYHFDAHPKVSTFKSKLINGSIVEGRVYIGIPSEFF